MNLIRVKINVSRILKEALVQGEKGKYLDLTLIPYKDGPKYDQDYMVVQDLGKEARQRGEKGPFIGNAKIIQPREQAPPQPELKPKEMEEESDDVPF